MLLALFLLVMFGVLGSGAGKVSASQRPSVLGGLESFGGFTSGAACCIEAAGSQRSREPRFACHRLRQVATGFEPLEPLEASAL